MIVIGIRLGSGLFPHGGLLKSHPAGRRWHAPGDPMVELKRSAVAADDKVREQARADVRLVPFLSQSPSVDLFAGVLTARKLSLNA